MLLGFIHRQIIVGNTQGAMALLDIRGKGEWLFHVIFNMTFISCVYSDKGFSEDVLLKCF